MLGFGPIGSRPLADDGGAVTTEINLDAGSYTLTGYDLSVTVTHVVALEAGSYTLTGYDLTVTPVTPIALEAGTYEITGYDLGVTVAHVVNLDAGSYTLTGYDLSVSLGAQTIELDAGEYTITGYPLTVQLSTSRAPETVKQAIAETAVTPFWCCDLLFDSPNALYFWNGIGDLELDGNTYTGVGTLLGVSEVRESSDIAAYGATLTLSGIPSNLVRLAKDEPYQGRRALVKFGVDVGGVRSSFTVFSGEMDQMNIAFGPDTCTIDLDVESRLIDLNRPRIRRYTDADQRARYPDDQAFEFVTRLQDESLEWKSA